MSTGLYAIVIADVRVVVGGIHVERLSIWLTSADHPALSLPDI
jgi:hypothetical protein